MDAPADRWHLHVLGIAQDGGMPHLGCQEARCREARAGRRPRERAAAIGLTDGTRAILFDATPDLPDQVHALGVRAPDAIFLTHAHIGHYAGLVHLGREVLGARGIRLFATPRMAAFLRANGPWSALVSGGHVVIDESPETDLGGVTVSAFPVPHRQEFSDTVGYRIVGPRRTVAYLPDIDSWEAWDVDVRSFVSGVDVAFVDGTFFSADELPGRSLAEVPHPTVLDTMARLEGLGGRVRFVHLNHTNPLLDDPTPATTRGFGVARQGETLEI